jgi:hypothetical protein
MNNNNALIDLVNKSQPMPTLSARYTHVNTANIVSALKETGFEVAKAQAARVRNQEKQGFQKHLFRLRREGQIEINGVYPEVLLRNSYDGTSAFEISVGLFRLVCLNGLMASQGLSFHAKVRHTGDALNEVTRQVQIAASESDKLLGVVEKWQSVKLDENRAQLFAMRAASFVLQDQALATATLKPTAETLLTTYRSVDAEPTLWNVFNRVQENVIKGRYVIPRSELSPEFRSNFVKARAIKGLDRSIQVNRDLWSLANEFAA